MYVQCKYIKFYPYLSFTLINVTLTLYANRHKILCQPSRVTLNLNSQHFPSTFPRSASLVSASNPLKLPRKHKILYEV